MTFIKNGLTKKISINSPQEFRGSVRELAKDGLSPIELQAIKSARRKARRRMHSVFATKRERKRLNRVINLKKI